MIRISIPRHLRLPAVALAAGCLAFAPATAAPPSYHVEVVDPLPGQNSVFPAAMNGSGVVVGVAGSDPFDPLGVPVVYSGGPLSELPRPTESLNFALGVGPTGAVAGTSGGLPCVWVDGRAVPLAPAGGLPQGFAFDVGAAGLICGGAINDLFGRQFPACWLDAASPGVLLRGLRGVEDGVALAVNGRGQIGGASGGAVAVRWDGLKRAPRRIGPLPGGISSEIRDLNERGDAAGRTGFPDNSVQAMLYVDATRDLIGLGYLDGSFSEARGVNDAGVVVGTATAGTTVHAFLWQDGVMHDLNDLVVSAGAPYDYLSGAVGIDDSGRIAAEAIVTTPAGTASRLAILTPVAP